MRPEPISPHTEFTHILRPGRTPIVVLGDDWGRHVSTIQHLFRHIIGRYPVIWVNSFGHRRPRLTVYDVKRATGKLAALVRAKQAPSVRADSLVPDYVVQPLALPWHDIAAVRQFNRWSLAKDIRHGLQELAPGERPVFVSGTPVAFDMIGMLNEIASIYFCMDDYGEIHGTDRDMLAPLEDEMLSRVDALVATAASLTVTRRPASARTLHLPQGCNYEHFASPRTVPVELRALPKPILGFAGGVGPAVDFGIIRALSKAFPEGSIVMLGPHQIDVSADTWPANVHFFGPRPYEELPAYLQGFDVGLVPYVHNDWTKAVDPLKLLEYLASGIPVVSTGLPEAAKYASVIGIADGEEAFVDAVRLAASKVDLNRRAVGQSVASGNRWEARADCFLIYVDSVAYACANNQAI